jgi:hypothetical protein
VTAFDRMARIAELLQLRWPPDGGADGRRGPALSLAMNAWALPGAPPRDLAGAARFVRETDSAKWLASWGNVVVGADTPDAAAEELERRVVVRLASDMDEELAATNAQHRRLAALYERLNSMRGT